MEKCFEDLRQDEKHVPDLLESIMKPTDPVKEELRMILYQISQFGYQQYLLPLGAKYSKKCCFSLQGPYSTWPQGPDAS